MQWIHLQNLKVFHWKIKIYLIVYRVCKHFGFKSSKSCENFIPIYVGEPEVRALLRHLTVLVLYTVEYTSTSHLFNVVIKHLCIWRIFLIANCIGLKVIFSWSCNYFAFMKFGTSPIRIRIVLMLWLKWIMIELTSYRVPHYKQHLFHFRPTISSFLLFCTLPRKAPTCPCKFFAKVHCHI